MSGATDDTSPATDAIETLQDLTPEQQMRAIFYLVGELAELVPLTRLVRCVVAARQHAVSATDLPTPSG